ncbi:hypothetical protein [Streptomyces sp. NPDC001903]|uniref:hypothetical protein n=1 Tax=Streptomyces sp. NPDC001903 TaxID=3364622 RepID=UPI0036991D7A
MVESFGLAAEGFDVGAEAFVRGVAGVVDGLAVRSEDDTDDPDDAVGDGDRTGEGDGAGDRDGCAGIPIAGASACTPIRLLPMATARIAPTTETGQQKPRSRRPRTPDWSTNTGAGAGSSKLDSGMADCVRRADPRSMGMPTGRTLPGLSLQGT